MGRYGKKILAANVLPHMPGFVVLRRGVRYGISAAVAA
jgi:hypothetical protein